MASKPAIIWKGSPNYRNIRSTKHGVVFHWIVGYLSSATARFTQPRQTATQYAVGPNAIHQYVDDALYAPGTGHNGANTNYISIEHEAGYMVGGTRFPGSAATLERSATLVAYLATKHGWGKMVPGVNAFGHSQFVATQCPGTLNWHWICARANELNGHPAAPTNPGGSSWTAGGSSLVDIDLKIGAGHTKTLQGQLGVTQDGIAGTNTNTALQRKVGTPADGLWGTNSTKALQAFVGAKVDGIWGSETTSKTIAAIAAGKFRGGAVIPATPAQTGKLVVDGRWGTLTTKAMQRALGVVADGIIGVNTIKAMQRRIGVTADGVIGSKTRKGLQRYVGTTQDGIWGMNTAKALQRKLNAGTF